MKYAHAFVPVAAAVGDPARAAMLQALMHGEALTASELAAEGGVTRQTASAHLNRLLESDLLAVEQQGRHRYYRLADEDVAAALEEYSEPTTRRPLRPWTGPTEPAMQRARVCYDHLAGEVAVALYDSLLRRELVTCGDGAPTVTEKGTAAFAAFGVDVAALRGPRPLCRDCLDWSVHRHHLAGALGAALLAQIVAHGWARRQPGTRVVTFSEPGEAALRGTFGLWSTE